MYRAVNLSTVVEGLQQRVNSELVSTHGISVAQGVRMLSNSGESDRRDRRAQAIHAFAQHQAERMTDMPRLPSGSDPYHNASAIVLGVRLGITLAHLDPPWTSLALEELEEWLWPFGTPTKQRLDLLAMAEKIIRLSEEHPPGMSLGDES